MIEGFTDAMSLDRYALYIFDYGAPVGLRLAMCHPERVSAIVSQNGNAYAEGFSDEWGPWEAYWREPSAANREACRPSLAPDTIRNWQYGTGADPNLLSPDGYELDIAYTARPRAEEIQLDLILDYCSNVALYPAFQSYFREHRPWVEAQKRVSAPYLAELPGWHIFISNMSTTYRILDKRSIDSDRRAE